MGLLIKNGKVFTKGEFKACDVLIAGNHIEKIAPQIPPANHQVIDADKKRVIPGLVDLHVHLREPGGEHKETIATGTKAAAKGGFTTIAAMPNTNPVPDSIENIELVNERIKESACVRVLPYASITQAQKGDQLADFQALKDHGAFSFSDDGVGVQSAGMMLEAMRAASKIGATIVAHCEENTLINNGSVHDGEFAKKHGLNGIPNVCEAVQIARDVLLAELADCHYHVCHVSTKESVRAIRDAKRAGIKVTAEVTPHHLLLSDQDIPGIDTNYKMNPPLRSEEDQKALLEGLLDGTIDFIATDHAPHAAVEKAKSIGEAPFGIVGLETTFPLLYTELVKRNILTLEQLINFMTVKPSQAFKLPYGELKEGGIADITIMDLDATETINIQDFASKGKNTPFGGWKCQGWPVCTIAEGKVAWEKGSVRV